MTRPIVCCDLDGTITSDPKFYAAELRGLMSHGFQVHILTANPNPESVLHGLDFHQGSEYSRITTVPLKHVGTYKVEYMKQVGAQHLIDNRKKTIKKVQKAGMVGHWRAEPKGK
jgi:hypothetical protein